MKSKYVPMAKRCQKLNDAANQCRREAVGWKRCFLDPTVTRAGLYWVRIKLCRKCAGEKS